MTLLKLDPGATYLLALQENLTVEQKQSLENQTPTNKWVIITGTHPLQISRESLMDRLRSYLFIRKIKSAA